jgi:hypothetical protein
MAGRAPDEVNPHAGPGCVIGPEDKVAAAGSCFAQRISAAIKDSGSNYLLVEEGPPFLSAEQKAAMGYGVYSARYGNVYTALQLLQLFQRAFGRFAPEEPLWRTPEGMFVDPFRPAVQPGGFHSEAECLWDRETHLQAVRRMFETLDVFIFTLGLTEAWVSAADGAVFPVCPGSGLGGVYAPQRHLFHNFTAGEVVSHLEQFLGLLRQVNPAARVILTVSPVPLMATFEPRHVLQASAYSKAVLRVACEELVRREAHVHYFASYEIVTATGDSRASFAEDRRTVSEAAVAHVITCFRRWSAMDQQPAPRAARATHEASFNGETMCDEDKIEAALRQAEMGADL